MAEQQWADQFMAGGGAPNAVMMMAGDSAAMEAAFAEAQMREMVMAGGGGGGGGGGGAQMGMAHQMRMEAAFQEANAQQQGDQAHAAMMHAQQSQMAGGGSMGAMEVTK